MKRGLLTILCLLGAIALYLLGEVFAATALFVAGGVLELVFWIRVFGGFQGEAAEREAEI